MAPSLRSSSLWLFLGGLGCSAFAGAACHDAPKPAPVVDAGVDPQAQLDEAKAALAAASDATKGAQVAAQTLLSKQVEAISQRADALGPRIAALSADKKARAQTSLVEVGRTATAAKSAVATLETTTGPELPAARAKAEAAIATFDETVKGVESALH